MQSDIKNRGCRGLHLSLHHPYIIAHRYVMGTHSDNSIIVSRELSRTVKGYEEADLLYDAFACFFITGQ